jgi:predicted RNase H-related nuclease YkuK (DUF458 family)
MSWRKLDGSRILLPLQEAVEQTIQKELEAGHKLRICIGTDSQVHSNHVSFATVIVFLREGKGGFMFINNETIYQDLAIRERMITEVTKSVTVAYEIADLLSLYEIPLEIHADINTDASFKSNVALREAMGYIRGMGYEFKAKPYAFASSSCADKVC